MKIAIPVSDGKLALHFGHCASFAVLDVDPLTHTILARSEWIPPGNLHALLPPWLAERGAQLIIAGGMGQQTQALCARHGMVVVLGAPEDAPEQVVGDFLSGNLIAGANSCACCSNDCGQ